jgi:integrase
VHPKWNRVVRKEDDVIVPTDLEEWYQAVAGLENPTMKHFLLFLIFTGLRRGAASQIKWDHIDFKADTITIPVEADKMRKARTIPMSNYVKQLLQQRHQLQIKGNPFVFPGEKIGQCLQEPKGSIANVVAKAKVKFSCHTLRKTFATTGARLDISKNKLDELLQHATSGDVTAHHYLYVDVEELREPMQKITDYLKEKMKIKDIANNKAKRTVKKQ